MNLFSIRIITNDVKKMAEFYERVTGIPKTQNIDAFAEIFTEKAILAIGSPNTLKVFDGVDHIVPEQNKTMILEFKVNDVDVEYERLKDFLQEKIVQKPKNMPWGNKSMLFKDPDGNLVNLFTTITPEAIKRWGE
jgi:predicted enzyme related to lactoylglutathione lyase